MQNDRIRVLHMIHHLRTGGAERMFAALLPALQRRGDKDFFAAVLDTPGEMETELATGGVPLYRFQKTRRFWPVTACALRQLVRTLGADILHMHDTQAATWGRIAAFGLQRPLRVITNHSVAGWRHRMKRRLVHRILGSRTDTHVAVCEAVRTSLTLEFGIPADGIRVIPNGVDSSIYRQTLDIDRVKKEFSIPPSVPVIGMVCRCSPEKGGEVFLEACARLRGRRVDFLGFVVGDGPSRSTWEARARELGVDSRVVFTGRIEHNRLSELVRCFDVAVNSSHEEACSLAVIEEMAAGIPVVATDVGGNASTVVDGLAGRIVPANDASEMAERISELLCDLPTRRRMGEAGRRRVCEVFSVESVAREYSVLYEDLIASKHASGNTSGSQARE